LAELTFCGRVLLEDAVACDLADIARIQEDLVVEGNNSPYPV